MAAGSFGTVRQLPSGRWQARYTGPDGVRHTAPITFDTRKLARDWLDDTAHELRHGTWRRPELARQRLDDYSIAWLTSRDDLKPRTRELYAGLLDRHILPTLGALELEQLSPVVVREWHTRLGRTTGTTARAQSYRLLRTITRQAVRDGALVVSPCQLPRAGAVVAPERTPATLPELEAIAAAVPERYSMLVQLGAWSGLRFGELTALRRSDVDVAGGSVRVSRAMHRIGGAWVVGDPKSAAGRRTVHIPPHLLPALAEHLERFTPAAPDALVFATSSGLPGALQLVGDVPAGS